MRFTPPGVFQRATNCHYSAFTAHLYYYGQGSLGLPANRVGNWLAIWSSLLSARLSPVSRPPRGLRCHDEVSSYWDTRDPTGIRMTRVSPLEPCHHRGVRRSPQARLLTSYSLSEVADGRFQVRLTGLPARPVHLASMNQFGAATNPAGGVTVWRVL